MRTTYAQDLDFIQPLKALSFFQPLTEKNLLLTMIFSISNTSSYLSKGCLYIIAFNDEVAHCTAYYVALLKVINI